MADQELATLNAEIVEAKARRDKLEALEAAGVAVNQERLAGVQKELVGLQEDKRRYIEEQGEKLSSRSPPPASSLVAPCMPANSRGGGLSRTLGNFQRDDQLTGWLQSHAMSACTMQTHLDHSSLCLISSLSSLSSSLSQCYCLDAILLST